MTIDESVQLWEAIGLVQGIGARLPRLRFETVGVSEMQGEGLNTDPLLLPLVVIEVLVYCVYCQDGQVIPHVIEVPDLHELEERGEI